MKTLTPSLVFFIVDIREFKGITIADSNITSANVNIINEALPVHFTTLLITINPSIAAVIVDKDYNIAQSILKVPFKAYKIVFVPDANSTKNIPVAEATVGRTPNSKSIGLKITPPPRPSIELRIPQIKPKIQSLIVQEGVHYMSPLTNL